MRDVAGANQACRRKVWVVWCVVALGLSIFAAGLGTVASAATFSTNVRVNAVTTGNQMNASMTVGPGGTIHVVWEDFQQGLNNPAIYYAKSDDGGASFTVGIPIVSLPPPNIRQKFPSVAASGNGHIHVTWTDLTSVGPPAGAGIFYARSEDGGISFIDNKMVSDAAMGVEAEFVESRVAYDGSSGCRIHVVWAVDDVASAPFPVWLTHDESPDCGMTFGTDFVVDPGGHDVALDVDDDGTVGVAYAKGSLSNIRFRMRVGGLWQSSIQVSDPPGGYNKDPMVAFDPSAPGARIVHVAWADGRKIDLNDPNSLYDWDIYTSKSPDGIAFGPNVRVSDDPVPPPPTAPKSDQSEPWMDVDAAGNPRIAWTDWRQDDDGHRELGDPHQDADVYFDVSPDGGLTFGTDQRVNDDPLGNNRENSRPMLVSVGTEVDVVWQDERRADGDLDVYFSGSGTVTLDWCDLPGFLTDGVDPDSGVTSQVFTFCVIYRSSTDTPPQSGNPVLFLYDCQAPVAGSPYPMTFGSWVSGPSWVSGARFYYSSTLACGVTYSYHFEAIDTMGRRASTPTLSGPDVFGWSEISPSQSPPPRANAGIAYDTESQVSVMFGGWQPGPGLMTDVWAYDHRTKSWTQEADMPFGSVADGILATYDASRDRIVVVLRSDADPTKMLTLYYDYNSDTWEDRDPISSPPAREEFSLAYDSDNDKTVLFGGVDGGTNLDDTWAYDHGTNTWVDRAPPSPPPARDDGTMIYDPAAHVMIMFGGHLTGWSGVKFDDTWEYDYAANAWTNRNPSSHPTARFEHAMVFDARIGQAILFGGHDYGNYRQDTWRYDYDANNWVQITIPSSPPPPARASHPMVFDVACGVSVVFGGSNASGTFEDTWTFVPPDP